MQVEQLGKQALHAPLSLNYPIGQINYFVHLIPSNLSLLSIQAVH